MAEFSGFWTTTASGAAGDQVAGYTQAQLSTFLKIAAACGGFEGVAIGYGNELACSDGGANTVDVATGGAVVDGKFYDSDAVENVNIPSAVGAGNTRIDRIVLRATWASYDVAITVISGTDAASPTAPAITQTSGTTYDIQLCQVLVDTSGNVTVTDERTWAAPEVDDSTIEIDQTTGQLQVKALGAAKIANRTRTFLVPAVGGIDKTSSAELGFNSADDLASGRGLVLPDSKLSEALGSFYLPSDYVSNMTAQALLVSDTGGNCFCKNSAYYGANGETVQTHSDDTGVFAAVAITAYKRNLVKQITFTSLAAGDFVELIFERDATNPLDTVGQEVRIVGWLVSYTADS